MTRLYRASQVTIKAMSGRLYNVQFSQLRKKTATHFSKFSRPISTKAPTSPRVFNLLWRITPSLCCVAFGYYYLTDTRSSIYKWFAVPAFRWIYPDAEDSHHAGTNILKMLYSLSLHPRERGLFRFQDSSENDISVTVFGQKLQNPVGTSAGIDKLAEIPDALFALGPAIVEVGGATPAPQEGNPRPRVFRLPNHESLINRYGLNSLGAEDMAKRLQDRVLKFARRNGYGTGSEAEKFVLNGHAKVPPGSLKEGKLLAVQIAKNKETKDEDLEAVCKDYVFCVEKLAPYADILVVNVSSPNTPGLRTLQKVEPLTYILQRVVSAAKSTDRKTTPKVMVKVSPDEDTDEQVTGIVEAIWKSGVDGVIVGNTTKRRRSVMTPGTILSREEEEIMNESGGLSGPMMFERTLALVKRYKVLLDRGPPSLMIKQKSSVTNATFEPKVIFASGGITNGKQALEILEAGASVAQIYTALVYGGLGTVTRIKREMIKEKTKV